ncbi:hypothetical protein WN944_027150 [Citrus x changshan-huyou]|uniref:Uncharacterized protein n=1 Tax=Citrus x changshan-huyou TaxID=2935761 RepID=A0AAP0Q9L5_9ROSI
MSVIAKQFLLDILKPLQRVKSHLKRHIRFCKTHRIWALQPLELVSYVEDLESQLRDIDRSLYNIQLELEFVTPVKWQITVLRNNKVGYFSFPEDKIQFIRDGLNKESLDDILLSLETHPSGYVQGAILQLWSLFQKEHARYSLGNLTINDLVCQFIRKLYAKPERKTRGRCEPQSQLPRKPSVRHHPKSPKTFGSLSDSPTGEELVISVKKLFICAHTANELLDLLQAYKPEPDSRTLVLESPNNDDSCTCEFNKICTTTSQIGLQQSPVEDDCAADDHYESAHDSDDRNEPESSIHELRSELHAGHSSINELKSELLEERREAQQYKEAVMGFMASFGAGSSKGAYGDSPFGPSHTAPDGYGLNVDASYGTHTDAGNDDEHTPMSLYSVYGDISGDSVQIFTEAPPGVSKFGRPYRSSYIFGSTGSNLSCHQPAPLVLHMP